MLNVSHVLSRMRYFGRNVAGPRPISGEWRMYLATAA